MSDPIGALADLLNHSPTRVVFGAGRLDELGKLAVAESALRVLLVCDAGVTTAGYVSRALNSLRAAGIETAIFDGVSENPTTEHVDKGLDVAKRERIDFLVALGGGSVMDCAKGINLLLTNGGQIQDYWGINKAAEPMLPMIAVPTTAGTGSEAQSFALISDPTTHQKMACGDRRLPTEGGLRPRVAILDPDLTRTQPPRVAAATGIDAIAHAVETAGCTARNELSIGFSQEAWKRLSTSYERAITNPNDDEARSNMLLGAHLAGCAIEQSMLGAAHACANPLTAHYGIMHGIAVAIMLPHVIRFNAESGHNPYEALPLDAEELAQSIERFMKSAGFPWRLSECQIDLTQLPALSEEAVNQWTAGFNPRKVGPKELLELYKRAAA